MALEWKYSSEAAALRERGMRATRRRVDILRLLARARVPLSVEAVHEKLRGTDLATVYRTLGRFTEAGMATRLNLGGTEQLFELSGAHHHHLVCTSCEKIEELNMPEKNMNREALRRSKNFAIVKNHSLEFFGLCKSCLPGPRARQASV